MERFETLRLVRQAHDEIVTLRRQIADLTPRAHAYDTIAINARLTVKPEGGYAQVDLLWELKHAADRLLDEQRAEAASSEAPVAEAI